MKKKLIQICFRFDLSNSSPYSIVNDRVLYMFDIVAIDDDDQEQSTVCHIRVHDMKYCVCV